MLDAALARPRLSAVSLAGATIAQLIRPVCASPLRRLRSPPKPCEPPRRGPNSFESRAIARDDAALLRVVVGRQVAHSPSFIIERSESRQCARQRRLQWPAISSRKFEDLVERGISRVFEDFFDDAERESEPEECAIRRREASK